MNRGVTKAGKKSVSKCWHIAYNDEHGQRRMIRGLAGKAETQMLAARIETDVALKRRGIIDPIADKVAKAEARPVSEPEPQALRATGTDGRAAPALHREPADLHKSNSREGIEPPDARSGVPRSRRLL
jgi:hypothetical protein